MEANRKAQFTLFAATTLAAVFHFVLSQRFGWFFPLPLAGAVSTVNGVLICNSVLQSFVLIFGISHLAGCCRQQTSLFGGPKLSGIVYSVLLFGVAGAAVPGFLHSHQ